MSVFDEIRESCEWVLSQAGQVSLSEDLSRYHELTALLDGAPLQHPPEHHLVGKGEETLIYFLLLDTVNFGSGYFLAWIQPAGFSGYVHVASRLKQWMEARGVPNPEKLRTFDQQTCADIFGIAASDPEEIQELMQWFAEAWRQLGELLVSKYESSYTVFLESARSAEQMIQRLVEMPFYRDVQSYQGRPVSFYKRAQILIQDWTMAEPEHPLVAYPDADALTAFADNLLPFVLRCDGVLHVSAELEARIEAGEEIPAESEAEVELRAAAVVAVERIAKSLSEVAGRPIRPRDVDILLWDRGQELKKTCHRKRHRTRTVFY